MQHCKKIQLGVRGSVHAMPILIAGHFLVQETELADFKRIHLSDHPLQESGASSTHPQQIVFSEKTAE